MSAERSVRALDVAEEHEARSVPDPTRCFARHSNVEQKLSAIALVYVRRAMPFTDGLRSGSNAARRQTQGIATLDPSGERHSESGAGSPPCQACRGPWFPARRALSTESHFD